MNLGKSRYGKAITIISVLALFTASLFYFKYGREKYVLYGDSLGYYMYLPSTFIYHNLDSLEVLPTDKEIPEPVMDYAQSKPENDLRSPLGHFIIQYTCGVALFELPFFAVSHLIASNTDLPANGYSEIYRTGIKLSTLFYSLLAIVVLFLWLRKFIPPSETLLTIILLLLGSNLFWFCFVQMGMAHPISFLLYSCLLYFTPNLYQKSRVKDFAIITVIIGLLILVRVTDAIAVLLPIFYGIYNWTDVKNRLSFWRKHYPKTLLSIPLLLLVLSPQLLYWKKYTGSFLFYSYGDQQFFWNSPQILRGLFGFENGWIPYSTVMFFALVAVFYFYQKNRKLIVPTLLILILHIYISYSWWCYNYINGYGSRPMVDIYPLLALPFGLLIHSWHKTKNKWWSGAMYLIVAVLVIHNLSMMRQSARNELISDYSNSAYYFSTMFKSPIDYRDLSTFDSKIVQPSEKDYKVSSNWKKVDFSDTSYSDKYGEELSALHSFDEEPFGEHYKSFVQETKVSANYIKIECKICIPKIEVDLFNQPLLVFMLNRGNKKIWRAISLHNKICMETFCDIHRTPDFWHLHSDQWGRIYFLIPLAELGDAVEARDDIQYGIWNPAQTDFYVDYIKMDFCDN